ncbi:uncharacterized protein [Physcomitrium patens]|uniref:uncharacterized protein isoform X3 n=1 Tax=Physcomitrium patens TaxID=3218 RepID=UPI000D1669A8|nr:MORC family CW-type zinc finger protein 2A-like isoform X3 [Physcomitrium patens]|eukprot:XP_024389114.1 MORC family CW-type zinc finger protein 2A-like isoform X3 [Physcomitrella patens]
MAVLEKRPAWRGVLVAREKTIQCLECLNPPFTMPQELQLEGAFKEAFIFNPCGMGHFVLRPLGTTANLVHKWIEFNTYLRNQAKFFPKNIISCGDSGSVMAGSTLRSGTRVHPSHLETLEQMHAAWVFGAVAELIDNARDAKATRLEISIEDMVLGETGTVPVLQMVDNGLGMNHEEIVKMLSFGHKRPGESDAEQIGHFGVGFKTGAMRIGRDAVIFTQKKDTCSMGFLSKSYNANLEDLEVPIVTYKRFSSGQISLDESVCTKQDEEKCKKAVTKHSPFINDISIGAQFARIENTGTRIFVYNLEQWDGKCIFEWNRSLDPETNAQNEKNELEDIKIRSRRVRVRAGQTSKQVPLDFSLRAYTEVLFLVPSMKIYLQRSLVNTRNLAKTLQNVERFQYHFVHEKDPIKNKLIPLTLGKLQIEYDRGNCGIFLYWHGRLIEAYKRVGDMVHSADIGRGIIGIMDVTDIMDFGDGKVGVLNNKQGFTDSDRFSKLEKWLDKTFGEYWDNNFDKFGLFEKEKLKEGERLVHDAEWVQCMKCSKWRELPKGWCADDLVGDWFCYMKPFEGNCDMAEAVQDNVITVAINRDGNKKVAPVFVTNDSDASLVVNPESSTSSLDIGATKTLKRLKRSRPGSGPIKIERKKSKP